MRRLIVLFALAALVAAPLARSNLITPQLPVGHSSSEAGGLAPLQEKGVFFKVKSPVPRGQLAHVTVQGRTGLCRITVSKAGLKMHLGPAPRVNPLRPKLANARNDTRVAWEWWTPTNTALGRWQVRVNCGRAATLHGTFLVTG
jgi:hypothetical protein